MSPHKVSNQSDSDKIKIYEPVKPIRPVLSHNFGTVTTAARLANTFAVDELRDIREIKGGNGEYLTYLRVVCENVEGELQEVYNRLAGHFCTAKESGDEGLQTETDDFDKGVCSSGRFPLNDGDNERSGCYRGRSGKKEDA